jgi:hypothetical protein
MMEAEVDLCGTVACHAGWFGIASKKTIPLGYDFFDSANEMADYLGFESAGKMEWWARLNPNLWGNFNGGRMFCASSAFNAPNERAHTLNLKKIGIWWLKVADRCEEAL